MTKITTGRFSNPRGCGSRSALTFPKISGPLYTILDGVGGSQHTPAGWYIVPWKLGVGGVEDHH